MLVGRVVSNRGMGVSPMHVMRPEAKIHFSGSARALPNKSNLVFQSIRMGETPMPREARTRQASRSVSSPVWTRRWCGRYSAPAVPSCPLPASPGVPGEGPEASPSNSKNRAASASARSMGVSPMIVVEAEDAVVASDLLTGAATNPISCPANRTWAGRPRYGKSGRVAPGATGRQAGILAKLFCSFWRRRRSQRTATGDDYVMRASSRRMAERAGPAESHGTSWRK
jgi:hypothetical protein